MSIKNNFPLLRNNNLIYLDNASTTQKPKIMIDSLVEYYTKYNSNIGRGTYDLASLSEKCYYSSKAKISSFFGADPKNTIFTSGSTDSLNLSAYIAQQNIKKKYIILPISEHHANILIWQRLAKQNNLKLHWIYDPKLIENPYDIDKDILSNTAILTISQVSNVTGEVYPIKKWCQLAKEIDAISIIDGSQAVASLNINIKDLDCDFYSFSAHKLYGPMGLGVLFIKNKFLNSQPLKLGGGIIEDVELFSHEYIEDISKFEAGTPNVANVFAFSNTLNFLEQNNWDKLLNKNHELGTYLTNSLEKINIKPLTLGNFQKTHISSFSLNNIHSHDVGTFLSKNNIAVRVGKHCTYPLHKHLKINSSIRASIGIYNTKNDIDSLIESINNCSNYFNKATL